jgi:hypothetical protein
MGSRELSERGISFRRIDDGVYDIWACGVCCGTVWYNSEAWSAYRWFIEGAPVLVLPVTEGAWGKKQKAAGWRRRSDAAIHVAMMASSRIIAKLCGREV